MHYLSSFFFGTSIVKNETRYNNTVITIIILNPKNLLTKKRIKKKTIITKNKTIWTKLINQNEKLIERP